MLIRFEKLIDLDEVIGYNVNYEFKQNNDLYLVNNEDKNRMVKISIKSDNDVVVTRIDYVEMWGIMKNLVNNNTVKKLMENVFEDKFDESLVNAMFLRNELYNNMVELAYNKVFEVKELEDKFKEILGGW